MHFTREHRYPYPRLASALFGTTLNGTYRQLVLRDAQKLVLLASYDYCPQNCANHKEDDECINPDSNIRRSKDQQGWREWYVTSQRPKSVEDRYRNQYGYTKIHADSHNSRTPESPPSYPSLEFP